MIAVGWCVLVSVMSGGVGLLVVLVLLGCRGEGAVVVCFSEVWCLGLLDDFLVWFARCFCVDWCLDSRMWLVVLLRNLFVAVVVA